MWRRKFYAVIAFEVCKFFGSIQSVFSFSFLSLPRTIRLTLLPNLLFSSQAALFTSAYELHSRLTASLVSLFEWKAEMQQHFSHAMKIQKELEKFYKNWWKQNIWVKMDEILFNLRKIKTVEWTVQKIVDPRK